MGTTVTDVPVRLLPMCPVYTRSETQPTPCFAALLEYYASYISFHRYSKYE